MTSSAKLRTAGEGVPGTARTSAGAPSGAASGLRAAVPSRAGEVAAFVRAGRMRAQWGSSWRRMLLASRAWLLREGAFMRHLSVLSVRVVRITQAGPPTAAAGADAAATAASRWRARAATRTAPTSGSPSAGTARTCGSRSANSSRAGTRSGSPILKSPPVRATSGPRRRPAGRPLWRRRRSAGPLPAESPLAHRVGERAPATSGANEASSAGRS